MNRQIARLALVGVGLVTALIVGTTYWQTWASASLADRQDNEIQRVAQFSIKRGLIRAADGTILASNRIKKVAGQKLYLRRYPQGSLFSHLVGFSPGYYLPSDPTVGTPRVYISHGTEDQVLTIEQTRALIVPRLQAEGYEVTYQEFEGAHEVPAFIAEAALDWLLGT